MQPLAVVTLIILGSSFAITVSLAAVIVIVLILGDEYPRLQHEFDQLLAYFAVFVAMTMISAASFYGLWKKHAGRYWAQAAMWSALLAIGWSFWPD